MNRSLSNRVLVVLMLVSVSFPAFAAETQAEKKDVDLTASDGAKLKASYFAAAKSGPGVLLLHQCNGDRKGWEPLARQLAAAGLNVLTIDMRGFGDSAGVPHDKATPQQAQEAQAKWPGDIDVAFQYLQTQPGVTKNTIGVGGASCGVDNSVQTAIRHPEVRSLVLMAGPTTYAGRQFLKKSSLPVLFNYADDDEFPDSITAIQWLYSLDASPGKKMVRSPRGGHGAEIFPVDPGLVRTITDWFVTTLIKTPGQAPPSPAFEVPQNVQVLTTIDELGGGGASQVKARLQQARQRDPKATLFAEVAVNLVGYEHLAAGDTKGAIEILQLNALAYPNSPNVYDSLGDVYLADGQKDLARENSQKALDLLPLDTTDPQARKDGIRQSAEQKLKQLGSAPVQ